MLEALLGLIERLMRAGALRPLDMLLNSGRVEPLMRLVGGSAFRAVNAVNQTVPVRRKTVVSLPVEQFDLANEYNPATSTFTPRTGGKFYVAGAVRFSLHGCHQHVCLYIRVNGKPVAVTEAAMSDGTEDVVNVMSILQLRAGDCVDLAVKSNTPGTILASPAGTSFEAARIPCVLT